jgi:hypothetical protein
MGTLRLTLDSTELALFINGNRKAVLNLGSSLGMEFSDDPNLYFGTNPNQPFSMGAKILWMKCGFLTVSSPIQRSQSSMDQAVEISAYARK